ncbi:TetR family transcriptional regulator [Ruania alkalisoli]|uniref:TetR family transcriptional regulator n=1 Tax=Ruania alkalisoli TaxID=2779775 RepID=A0A7M1SUD9_9MICO|nr:TetR family transcriptional regulator [Ruania alkalisoli]QOR70233.1 TetR family transcriptional regulator [Ruania alkalisoli]
MTDQRSARTGRPARSGRRPGANDTREQILRSALTLFSEHGYGGTTIRAVASDAAVDPALVMHFFGSKDQLFAAVLAQVDDLPARIGQSLQCEPEHLAHRLATFYLTGWESEEIGPVLRAVLRSASASEEAAHRLREAIEGHFLRDATAGMDPALAERLPFAMAHLFGIATARYVLQVGPVANLPLEELIEIVTPGLDAVLRP